MLPRGWRSGTLKSEVPITIFVSGPLSSGMSSVVFVGLSQANPQPEGGQRRDLQLRASPSPRLLSHVCPEGL